MSCGFVEPGRKIGHGARLADYVLKIGVPDVGAYEAFQARYLLRNKWVRPVPSSFVLKEVKAATALPL